MTTLKDTIRIKFYIFDGTEFVDFSDPTGQGTNRFISVGSISYKSDTSISSSNFATSSATVTLDNSDGFFDKPAPSTLKRVDGTAASFGNTEGFQISPYYRKKAKIAVQVLTNTNVTQEYTIGIFFVDEITTGINDATAEMSLDGLSKVLDEASADSVKNGLSWYQRRPLRFLVESLLRQQFGTEINAALPDTFTIPTTTLQMSTRDGSRTSSIFGRPPEYDGTNWLDKGLICRAIVFNNSDNKLYLGCDNELWKYDPVTDIYTQITGSDLTTVDYIRYLWYNPNDVDFPIYGLSYTDNGTTSEVWYVDAKVIKSNGTTYAQVGVTLADFFPGTFTYINGVYATGVPSVPDWDTSSYFGSNMDKTLLKWENASSFDKNYGGEALAIPFLQRTVVQQQGFAGYQMFRSKDTSGDISDVEESEWLEQDFATDNVHERGYWSGAAYVNAFMIPWPGPLEMRMSFGQTGCTIFNENIGTKGGVIYVAVDSSSVFAPMFSIKIMNLDTEVESTLLGFLRADVNDNSFIVMQPTCGCKNPNNENIYMASIAILPDIKIDSGDWVDHQKNRMYIHYVSTSINGFSKEPITGATAGTKTINGTVDAYYSEGDLIILEEGATYNHCEVATVNVGSLTVRRNLAENFTAAATCKVLAKNIYDSSGLNNSGPSPVNLLDRYRTPLELIFNNNASVDHKLQIITFNRNRLGEGNAYSFCTYSLTGVLNEMDVKIDFPSQLKGLTISGSNDNYDTYMMDVQQGSIYKFDISTQLLEIQDGGLPPVFDEPNLSSNLTIDTTNNIIYGISAPTFPYETQPIIPYGKYYLWKYDSSITDRVALADFSKLSRWKVLGLLAQSINYTCGFDLDGNFFFVPKTLDTIADHTITADPTNNQIINIEKNTNFGEIYNLIKTTPFEETILAPTFDVRFINRDEDEKTLSINASDMSIEQRSLDAQEIRLICTFSGRTATNTNMAPMFKWLTQHTAIQGMLSAVYAGGTTLTLVSVFGGETNPYGPHVGDFFVIIDPTTNTELIRKITAVDENSNQITIASAFTGVTLPLRTPITILKKTSTNSSTSYTKWSDEGVTLTTSEATIGNNTVSVADINSLPKNTLIKVGPDIRRVLSIAETTSPAGTITIEGTWSETVASGAVVMAWWSPKELDISYEIGDTKVGMKFLRLVGVLATAAETDNDTTIKVSSTSKLVPGMRLVTASNPTTAVTIVSVNSSTNTITLSKAITVLYNDAIVILNYISSIFKEGDTIIITTEGAKLDEVKANESIIASPDSIALYGIKEYTLSNRFIDRLKAPHFLKLVLDETEFPKYTLQVVMKFDPTFSFISDNNDLTRVDVRNERLFPVLKNNTFTGNIQEIAFTPASNKMTLLLRGTQNI